MKALLARIRREDSGVLTFEWILLITVLVIGVVGGLSAVRDAVITELGDVAGAVVQIDQSYTVPTDSCRGLGTAFSYQDTAPEILAQRATDPVTQGPVGDCGQGD